MCFFLRLFQRTSRMGGTGGSNEGERKEPLTLFIPQIFGQRRWQHDFALWKFKPDSARYPAKGFRLDSHYSGEQIHQEISESDLGFSQFVAGFEGLFLFLYFKRNHKPPLFKPPGFPMLKYLSCTRLFSLHNFTELLTC